MPPQTPEAQRWLTKADNDRAGAEAAVDRRPPVTDVAAFHCQQSVEKMLKAFLTDRNEPFERTHDLIELLALCARHDPTFDSLRDQVGPLTPYAVRYRYPGPVDPTEDEVKVALLVVHRVRDFVVDRIGGTAQA